MLTELLINYAHYKGTGIMHKLNTSRIPIYLVEIRRNSSTKLSSMCTQCAALMLRDKTPANGYFFVWGLLWILYSQSLDYNDNI